VDLSNEASMIALASASGGQPTGSGVVFTLKLDRIISQQSAAGGNTIQVLWDDPPEEQTKPAATYSVGGNGIWFLKQDPNGEWRLLPVIQGSVPFEMTFYPSPITSLPSNYAYAPTASSAVKLAAELSAAIEAARGKYNLAFYELLQADFDQLSSPLTQMLYQRLAMSAIPQEQILGLRGLIRTGNSASVSTARALAAQFENYSTEWGMLVRSVRDTLRSSDPTVTQNLGSIATDVTQSSSWREASAHALACTHSPESLPFLAGLLADTDPILRSEAVSGLAAFANGLPAQTPQTTASLAHMQLPQAASYQTPQTLAHFAFGASSVQKNEQFYVAFWAEWWQTNRASLGY